MHGGQAGGARGANDMAALAPLIEQSAASLLQLCKDHIEPQVSGTAKGGGWVSAFPPLLVLCCLMLVVGLMLLVHTGSDVVKRLEYATQGKLVGFVHRFKTQVQQCVVVLFLYLFVICGELACCCRGLPMSPPRPRPPGSFQQLAGVAGSETGKGRGQGGGGC